MYVNQNASCINQIHTEYVSKEIIKTSKENKFRLWQIFKMHKFVHVHVLHVPGNFMYMYYCK